MLAERAGVTLTAENKQARNARDRLYEASDAACAFFETKLSENQAARSYVQKRGVEDSTSRSFRLGFAPDGWQDLHDHLKAAGFTDQELVQSGLIKKGDKGRLYDRFRSRIMFPIMDPAGRVIAFSGRIFGEAADDEKNAKYLNSPETALFDKGRILYGYDKAKAHIRKYDFSILVEGQMDLVMSHQAGYTNTVAVSGTGLTEHHLQLLGRLSRKLVMAFDADEAGIASSGRAASLALARAMDVKVAHVPLGKDPADCILEDKGQWRKAVKDSKHVIEFYLDVLEEEGRKNKSDKRQLLLRVRDTVLPFIAQMPGGVDQAHFVTVVAERIGLKEDAVWQDVRTYARDHARDLSASREPDNEQPTKRSERNETRREARERELAGFLFWQETLEPRVLAEEHLRERAKELSLSLEAILAHYVDEKDKLAFHAELTHDETLSPHEALDVLLGNAAKEAMLEEREHVTVDLRDAEHLRDQERTTILLKRFQELSHMIEQLEQTTTN